MAHRFQWLSNNSSSTNWQVGNSQMAKFSGSEGDYHIMYKQGGRFVEIVAEAEWIITSKKATHAIIDGIQNSVCEIRQETLNLETEILPRLKALNKRAQVV